MEAMRETTKWKSGGNSNHTYLLDGMNLVAYIKDGDTVPFYFKNPIKGFDRRGRTFVRADIKMFKARQKSSTIEVKGSKGNVYFVDTVEKTCTCSSFQFRGKCKHIEAL